MVAFSRVDLLAPDLGRYLERLAALPVGSAREEEVRAAMEGVAAERGFPIVGPQVGRLLELLARGIGARHVLEMGSGFGYSAWWLARAVGPQGEVVLTEGSAERAAEARAHLERAGLSGRVRVEVGDALQSVARESGPFDLIFNDVDKHAYPGAFEAARPLVRPGGLFVSDNMLWQGRVLAPQDGDPATLGVLELMRRLTIDPDFLTVLVPLRDGVTVSLRHRWQE
jgi:predicted O-methyltransferase YrrM